MGSLCYEELIVGLNYSCWSEGGLSFPKKLGEGWLPSDPVVFLVLMSSTVATEKNLKSSIGLT